MSKKPLGGLSVSAAAALLPGPSQTAQAAGANLNGNLNGNLSTDVVLIGGGHVA
jgi:hypothetical protein